MDDLWAALGLAMVIEGAAYALAPNLMRRLLAEMLSHAESHIRLTGFLLALGGLIVVWLIRG